MNWRQTTRHRGHTGRQLGEMTIWVLHDRTGQLGGDAKQAEPLELKGHVSIVHRRLEESLLVNAWQRARVGEPSSACAYACLTRTSPI